VPSGASFVLSSTRGLDGSPFGSATGSGAPPLRSICGAVLVWLNAGDLESRLVVRCNSDDG
jgi:hypothetical protein